MRSLLSGLNDEARKLLGESPRPKTRRPGCRNTGADESIGSLERILASGAATAFSLSRGDPPLILLSTEALTLTLLKE